MCGINGFVGKNSELLRAMHAATAHRGPDDQGFFETPEISLAHNRLSIIDLSAAGHQPMTSADGRYTVIFNGEIYNYLDLKKELIALGAKFISHSDTEVLLAGWAEWGIKILDRLNGIFAFALWDSSTKKLILARDQVGVKPLYYYAHNGRLAFSSEIKGLLQDKTIPRTIDVEALNFYFRFLYILAPRTIFTDIKVLPAGHYLMWENGKINLECYWQPAEGPYLTNQNEAQELLRETTRAAIKRQLVSDRPLGVFLSGGIDSTTILGVMAKDTKEKIKTFSVGYSATAQSEKYNRDANLAARSAEFFGAEHHKLELNARDIENCFVEVVRHMDQPTSNHIQPATFLLAKFAKPQITVALGGDGGDELFGGYDRYWYSRVIARAQALATPLGLPALQWFARHALNKPGWAEKLATTPGLTRFLSFMGQKNSAVDQLIKPEINNPQIAAASFQKYFSKQWADFENQFMATDLMTWLPDESLVRSDKMTMAHALEERVPLLDLELVKLAQRLPARWKLGSAAQGKKIFRAAMAEYIPPFVANASKQGWFSPAAKWIRNDLKDFFQTVFSDSYLGQPDPYLNMDLARDLLQRHCAGEYHLNILWAILTYRVWYRQLIATTQEN